MAPCSEQSPRPLCLVFPQNSLKRLYKTFQTFSSLSFQAQQTELRVLELLSCLACLAYWQRNSSKFHTNIDFVYK